MRKVCALAVSALIATVGLAACGGGGAAPSTRAGPRARPARIARGHHPAPEATIPRPVPGSGAAAGLAHRLQTAGLGCRDYRDVPQDATIFQRSGIRDIGDCDLGHLGVFTGAASRDRWIQAQLTVAQMGGCAEGHWWAVCVWRVSPVGNAKVQNALRGLTA